MPSTFLTLSTELSQASNELEKEVFTERLASFLGSEKDLSETVLRPLLLSELARVDVLSEIMDSGYFCLRQRVYQDGPGRTRVAVGVAFIQDYTDPDPDLDRKVLEDLLEVLKSENLELLVNDLTVNGLQVRDGALGSML